MLRNFINYAAKSHWNIGFVEDSLNSVFHSVNLSVHWLKHFYKNRWFADPFILNVDDNYVTILVEEYNYSIDRGRIAKLIVDRTNYTLREMKVILDLPTHLSFPVIFRKEGRIYIMPENCESGGISYYSYNPNNDNVELCGEVVHLPLADATIAYMPDGKNYILSTKIPNQNGNELYAYHFNADLMKADPIPAQVIRFEGMIARNAGSLFVVGNSLYRPAQDCNGGYGNGVYLQRVEYLNGNFSFCNMKRFFPHEKKYDMGYHTFNHMDGLTVVDAHGHDRPLAWKTLCALRRVKHLI